MNNIKINAHTKKFLITSESKAIATQGVHGINVVPVSSLHIEKDSIWLINYFMQKTHDNILSNPNISITCWTKMFGYQIKGIASYEENGPNFEKAKKWIKRILPDRIVQGVIIINPTEIYDIAPTKNTPTFKWDFPEKE